MTSIIINLNGLTSSAQTGYFLSVPFPVGNVAHTHIGAIVPNPSYFLQNHGPTGKLLVHALLGSLRLSNHLLGESVSAQNGVLQKLIPSKGLSVFGLYHPLTTPVSDPLIGQHITANIGGFTQTYILIGEHVSTQYASINIFKYAGQQANTAFSRLLPVPVGLQALSLIGSFIPSTMVFFTGRSVTASISQILVDRHIGQQAITRIGSIYVAHNPLPSLRVTAQRGNLSSPIRPNAPVGQVAISHFGNIVGFNRSINVLGQQAISARGIIGTPKTPNIFGQQVNTFSGRLLRFPVGQQVNTRLGNFNKNVSISGLFVNTAFHSPSVITTKFIGNQANTQIGRLKSGPIGLQANTKFGSLLRAPPQITGLNVNSQINLLTHRIAIQNNNIGQVATTHLHSLVININKNLLGVVANSRFGTIFATKQNAKFLPSVNATTSIGSFSKTITSGLSGLHVNTINGNLSIPRTISLVGNNVSTRVGNLFETIKFSLLGQYVTSLIFPPTVDISSIALRGLFATANIGNILSNLGVISGVSAFTGVSTTYPSLTKPIFGQLAISRINNIGNNTSPVGESVSTQFSSFNFINKLNVLLIGNQSQALHGVITKQLQLAGQSVFTHNGFFRTTSLGINGLTVDTFSNTIIPALSVGRGLRIKTSISNFGLNNSIFLTGLEAITDRSDFLSIFRGVFVVAKVGIFTTSITYPPHPSRTPPPYRLGSIHDLFTSRGDNSDPTNILDRRRQDLGPYIIHR